MASIELNSRFRHATSGDYSIKDNALNRLKQVYVDIVFADDEEYDGGLDIDFSRWIRTLISVETLHEDIANNRYVPQFTLSDTEFGEAKLELHDFGSTLVGEVSDAETELLPNSVADLAIRGKTVTIRVTGY